MKNKNRLESDFRISLLEKYYGKFNEDHRLETRHGKVEFETSMKFIHEIINQIEAERKLSESGQRVSEDEAKLSESKRKTSESEQSVFVNGQKSFESEHKTSENAQKLSEIGINPENPGGNIFSQEDKNLPRKSIKILDVGAGTGRYSLALCREGFDVTAVEPVKRNIEVLRSHHEKIKTWQGNALNLSFLEDNSFDITIMFGPMYHLCAEEERLCAFSEAKRVTKKGGFIFAAYIMNEYAVLKYCFGEDKIAECLENGSLTGDFHCVTKENDLYSYLRLGDIDSLNEKTGLKLIKRFAQDGASDYMRRELNAMSEETFSLFIKYHLATCEMPELLGASSHVVDVLQIDN